MVDLSSWHPVPGSTVAAVPSPTGPGGGVATSLVGFAMIFALLAALIGILACADRLFSGGYVCSPSPRQARRAARARRARLHSPRQRFRLDVTRGRLRTVSTAIRRVPQRLTELPTAMTTVRRDARPAVRSTGRR